MVREADLLRYGALYGGNTDLRNPLISPLYGDYRGIPPLLIQVGEAEIILDDSTRVAERAKQAGVQVDLEVWDEMVTRVACLCETSARSAAGNREGWLLRDRSYVMSKEAVWRRWA